MIATLERPTRAASRAAQSEPSALPAGLADALDFQLPPELEAREPPEARGLARDGVRLLVTFRRTDWIVHARFADLPDFLRAGDVVVVNDSATLPAALTAQNADGRPLALHLSTRLPGETVSWRDARGAGRNSSRPRPRRVSRAERGYTARGEGPYLWVVEPRQYAGAAGETLALPAGASATLLAPYRGSRRLWVARLDLPGALVPYLRRWGRPIAYSYVRGTWPLDAYQTVYAAEPGSAEMPSAGRAFTPELLARLRAKGVVVARLTLHTGVASLEHDEPPYPEAFRVPPETAAAVRAARAAGRRVIAVGTTVVRSLESATDAQGRVAAAAGWTDVVITPQRGVRVVDGLLTGFHEPRASHLAMLEAIAGRPHLVKAYAAALAGRYLWHEFGDLHLIL